MITPLFLLGDIVQSTRDPKLYGTIIGYGTLRWPDDEEDTQLLVYLVQTRRGGSSSLGPSVAVFRADQVAIALTKNKDNV